MTRRVPAGLLVVWLGLMTGPASAQGTLTQIGFPGENASTARRLAAVDQLVAESKWAEAITEYLHILDEAGDDLVPLDPRHSVAARRLCHLRLAALPPKALQLYRDRVDGQVKKWWEQAEAAHDTHLLRRIVQEAFCSRFGDRALDFLGDLAFERGDFEEAEQWWRMLLPADRRPGPKAEGGPAIDLVFPDPQVDLARVRAKQILSQLCRGDREAIAETLQAYRARYGDAAGDFAARQGKYADTLQELAGKPDALVNPVTNPPWSTFAGAASRNDLLPQAPASYLVALPPIPLDTGNRGNLLRTEEGHILTPSAEAQEMAFYPVIAGGQVLVADAGRVQSFDLTTGVRTGSYSLTADFKSQGKELDLDFATPPGARYTLTVAGRQIFARLGNACVGALRRNDGVIGDSCIVCLDQRPNAEGKLVRRWLVRAQEGKSDSPAVFEGSPLVHDGRLYVARARIGGAQVATAIECYSAATGYRHWHKEITEIRDVSDREPRWHQHLLTLAGSQIVYCTHSGAVVAVDAATGRRAWAVRYLSRGLKTAAGAPSPRDLAPCVAHAGRLFVAPADFDRILCLDAATGKILWECPAVEVVHLLGVAGDKLIVTTGRSSPGVAEAPEPRGIRALDVYTGRMLRTWMQPADGTGDLPSLGRGLLAGGKVLWPVQRGTQDSPRGLLLLDQQTGEAARDNYYFSQRFRGIVGNLALGEGCLAAADAHVLRLFVPAARRLGQFRKEAADHPDSATAQLGLALAEMDAGLIEPALERLAQAERLAEPRDSWEGKPLRTTAQQHRHRLLLSLADRLARKQQWRPAAAWLEQAAADVFPVADRLTARVRLAQLWTAAREPDRALRIWQGILADDRLRRLETVGPTGLPTTGAALAFNHIEDLKRTFPGVYEPLEQKARALAAETQGGPRQEVLAQLVREFPNAAVTGPTLRRLAERQHSGADQAARAYRSWLQLLPPDAGRCEARAALARLPGRRPAPSAAADPDPALPLGRTWQVALDVGERLLDTAAAPDCYFFARGRDLICRESATGQTRWVRSLRSTPYWIASYADCILAAGTSAVQALSLRDGAVFWEFTAPGKSPIAADDLSHFQLAAGRLFCLQGQSRLLALDALSGQILWEQRAPGAGLHLPSPGGRFNPHYHAGPDWVVLQTMGGRIHVLDSAAGRPRDAGERRTPLWPQAPLAVDAQRLCLVAGLRQVELFEPASGKIIWTRTTLNPSITCAPPQVSGNASALFLLVDGWQLERLDPATGRPLWSAVAGSEPVILERAAWDQQAMYYATGPRLCARRLADGHLFWSVRLPHAETAWRVDTAHRRLWIFPAEPTQQVSWSPFFAVPPRTFPFFGTYALVLPFNVQYRELPLLLCDAGNGKILQQLRFREPGPCGHVQRVQSGAIAAASRTAWRLKPGGEPLGP